MLNMLESQVFSRLQSGFSDRIKSTYPELNFTTSNRVATDPRFPTVYVHMMQSPETGGTLEGTELVAVNASFQIEVSDNKNSQRADDVAREVFRVMKTLRFQATGVPFHDNVGDTYRTVARYRRIVADGDIL